MRFRIEPRDVPLEVAARRLGKTPVLVKDTPGFLVNRLLMVYSAEALWLLDEGHSIEDVDRDLADEPLAFESAEGQRLYREHAFGEARHFGVELLRSKRAELG